MESKIEHWYAERIYPTRMQPRLGFCSERPHLDAPVNATGGHEYAGLSARSGG